MERIFADSSATDGGVTVDVRPYRLHGVVEVHSTEIIKTDYLVKLVPDALKLVFVGKVVSCGKGVAGVYTHPYPALIVHTVDNVPKVMKRKTEVSTLSGSVFDNGSYSVGLVKGNVY